MALCSSNWYQEPQRVQKLMVNMMMRCNKELCLEIGPFTVMTLRTFLGVSYKSMIMKIALIVEWCDI